MWYCHNQWTRTESPEITWYIYDIDFCKGAKIIQWGEIIDFNKCYWNNCVVTCKRIILDLYLIPYKRLNSKLTKDLNLEVKTSKLSIQCRRNAFMTLYLAIIYGYDTKSTTHERKRNINRI